MRHAVETMKCFDRRALLGVVLLRIVAAKLTIRRAPCYVSDMAFNIGKWSKPARCAAKYKWRRQLEEAC